MYDVTPTTTSRKHVDKSNAERNNAETANPRDMTATKPCTSESPANDCLGAGAGDGRKRGDGQSATPAASKLVFERQGEFARELLCCMFQTAAMADLEVVIDDSSSIRCHIEVLVRVSGYFRTLLQGNPIALYLRCVRSSFPVRRGYFLPVCVCVSVCLSVTVCLSVCMYVCQTITSKKP